MDSDGAAGPKTFVDVVRFAFTNANDFTALNALGWAPNGGSEGVVDSGTSGDDVYVGTRSHDSRSGGDGADS